MDNKGGGAGTVVMTKVLMPGIVAAYDGDVGDAGGEGVVMVGVGVEMVADSNSGDGVILHGQWRWWL